MNLHIVRLIAVPLVTLLIPTVVAAAASRVGPPVIDVIAVPVSSPMTIDGKLTEAIWEQAPSISEFVQRDPAEGEAPSQRTDTRIAYDHSAVYVGVRAFDTQPQRTP